MNANYLVLSVVNGYNPSFEIEIIDFVNIGKKIKNDYPYLSINTIIEITEFKNYLIDVYTLPSLVIPPYVEADMSSDASKKVNIFEWWLKAKRFDLQKARKNVRTINKYFENFS